MAGYPIDLLMPKSIEHKITNKFIHEWLPLQDHHHINTSEAHLCPALCSASKQNDLSFPHVHTQKAINMGRT